MALDFVLTVCDQAAGEACPARPGRPIRSLDKLSLQQRIDEIGRRRTANTAS